MRAFVLAFVLGLPLSLPVHAQSVTLDVCNMGAIDIDVFVSQGGALASSHVTPATCTAVAKNAGGLQQAYIGIAFTDSRGQWGAPRRFDRVPDMGSRELPPATKLAMTLKGEKLPPPAPILSASNQSASVRHGNATATLPLQLNFQPSVPGCKTLPVGSSSDPFGRGRTTYVDDFCEDLHYTLMVEGYPDSHEATLDWLSTGGGFLGPSSPKMEPVAEVDWPEIMAGRKLHAAPQPITWKDLVPSVERAWGGARLESGEEFKMPDYLVVRGTVAAVEVYQYSIDANTQQSSAEILFRESPVVGKPYLEFHACSPRPDVLQEVFGADYRTSMVGKVIEVRARAEQSACRGQAWGMNITLAREVRPVDSTQFPAGTRAWVPPAVYVAPPPPPPTSQQIQALIAEGASNAQTEMQRRAQTRLKRACDDEADKGRAAAGTDGAKNNAVGQRYTACIQSSYADAMKEGERGAQCARDVMKDNPAIRTDPFWAGVTACVDAGRTVAAAAPAQPTAPAQPAAQPPSCMQELAKKFPNPAADMTAYQKALRACANGR